VRAEETREDPHAFASQPRSTPLHAGFSEAADTHAAGDAVLSRLPQ